MLGQSISAVCVLGIVIVALLTMTRTISMKEAAHAVGRVFLVVVGVLFALCLLKPLLVTGVTAALWLLKSLVLWLAVIAVVIIVLTLVVRILISRFKNSFARRGNRERGEL